MKIQQSLFRCYLSVSGAGVALQVTKVTGGVLQTEASLVSLCHFTAGADLQQIIMAELIHTVEVPVGQAWVSCACNLTLTLLRCKILFCRSKYDSCNTKSNF